MVWLQANSVRFEPQIERLAGYLGLSKPSCAAVLDGMLELRSNVRHGKLGCKWIGDAPGYSLAAACAAFNAS